MGSYRTSAARTGATLWRAVQLCKDGSTALNSSLPALSAEPVCLLRNQHLFRRIHQLRWIGGTPVTLGVEQLQFVVCSSFCENRKEDLRHNPSSGITSFISGRQLSRRISSHVSKSVGHDEDFNVKGDDNAMLGVDDGDAAASVLSSEERPGETSHRTRLWGRIEDCMGRGQTVAQIKLYMALGHSFTKEDSVFLICKLRAFGRYLQAAEIADWIVETNMFPREARDHVVRLSVKGKLGLSKEVEKIFNESPPELQTEIAYNAVIKHFCERGMVKKANEWVHRLVESGLITHGFAFNRLLVLCKDKNNEEKVDEVLETMSAAGVPKDIYTYNILMAIKGKRDNVIEVEKVFEECKADPNIKVDSATYSTLAAVYCNLGLTEEACAALEEGEKLGIDKAGNVDVVMATLWCKLGNKEKVLHFWEIMKQKENLAARTYVVMIETFGKLGMVDHAQLLFDEMQQTKGQVRPRQFTALLAAYVSNNVFDKAEVLIGKIDSFELKRSSGLNHYIVNAYLKMGNVDKALGVVNEAKWKGGFPLWFTTMLVLLSAVAERGDVFTAEKIFDNVKTTYNQKNVSVYNLLLQAYVTAGIPAEGFLERMAADRVLPDEKTHELLRLCSAYTQGTVQSSASIPAVANIG